MLGAAALLGCTRGQVAEPIALQGSLDLLSLLSQARLITAPGQSERISRWHTLVDGETREVLFMHPSSRAEFPRSRMTLDAHLELTFGVLEAAWSQGGDGVQFVVAARDESGEERRLFAAYVDPKHRPEDRRWVDAVVTLGMYAGRDVVLILETTPGPAGDDIYDWGAWSRAVLDMAPR